MLLYSLSWDINTFVIRKYIFLVFTLHNTYLILICTLDSGIDVGPTFNNFALMKIAVMKFAYREDPLYISNRISKF